MAALIIQSSLSGAHTPNPLGIVVDGDQQDYQLDGSETPCGHGDTSDLAGALQSKLQNLQAQTQHEDDEIFPSGRFMCQKSGAHEFMKVVLFPEDNAMLDQFLRPTFPPPPQPHEAPRPRKGPVDPEKNYVISRGSAGHPQSCAAACKHVKRKGGCREGADCPKCHECFWVRHPASAESPEQLPEEGLPEVSASVGSLNHPHGCGEACKYLNRKGGCRDGKACPNCHLCQWTRVGNKEQTSLASQTSHVLNLHDLLPESTHSRLAEEIAATAKHMLPTKPPPGLTMASTPFFPSAGSTGHPFSCGAACKYAQKMKGCKDGLNCPQCHLCRWSKNGMKSAEESRTFGPCFAL